LQGYGSIDEETIQEQQQHTTNRPPYPPLDPNLFPPSNISATWRRLYDDLNKTRAAAASATNQSTGMYTGLATGIHSPTRTTTESVKGMLRPTGMHHRPSPADLTNQQLQKQQQSSILQNIQKQLQTMNQHQQASISDSDSTGPGFFDLNLHHQSDISSVSSDASQNRSTNNNNTHTTAERYDGNPMVDRDEHGRVSFVYSATNPFITRPGTATPATTHHSPALQQQTPQQQPSKQQPSKQQTPLQQIPLQQASTSSTSKELAATLERERLHADYYADLKRRSKRPKHTMDSAPTTPNNNNNNNSIDYGDDDIMPDLNEESAPWPSTPQPLPGDDNDDEAPLAYDFSPMVPGTPHSQRDTSSQATSSGVDSMMSMISGTHGRIPARFALHYFPEVFHTPPGSTKLTRMYTLFSERPGQRLTLDQVAELMNVDGQDLGYVKNSSRPLLDLLSQKRFLRRLDKGWVLRN
jgi:hypothetical protein